MTFLIILGAVVLFFVLLVSLPLKLELVMLETLTVRAGVGPVMLTLTPKKERKVNPADFSYKKHQKRLEKERKRLLKKAEKKRRKNEKKSAKNAEAERIKKDTEKAGEELKKKKFPLGFILALAKFAVRELDRFIGYFRIEIVSLHVTAGGKDAAAIGKTYGILAQSVPLLIELLDHKTRLKRIKKNAVSVRADFLLEKTKVDAHLRLKLPIGSILKVGFHALCWFIGQKIKEAKEASSLPAPSPAPAE